MPEILVCEIKGCHEQAKCRPCNGDGRLHWHGAIHLFEGGLAHVCEKHFQQDKQKWEKARIQRVQDNVHIIY